MNRHQLDTRLAAIVGVTGVQPQHRYIIKSSLLSLLLKPAFPWPDRQLPGLTEELNDKILERNLINSSPWVVTTWGQTCKCQGTNLKIQAMTSSSQACDSHLTNDDHHTTALWLPLFDYSDFPKEFFVLLFTVRPSAQTQTIVFFDEAICKAVWCNSNTAILTLLNMILLKPQSTKTPSM